MVGWGTLHSSQFIIMMEGGGAGRRGGVCVCPLVDGWLVGGSRCGWVIK